MSQMEDWAIPELMRATASRYAAGAAVWSDGQTLDFTAANRHSDAVAVALAERGIEKGDRVALYSMNSYAFIAAYFGIVKAGATAVPINLLLNPKEIAYILKDAEVRALLYAGELGKAVSAFRGEAPGLSFCVSMGRSAPLPGDLQFSDLLSEGRPAPPVKLDPREDVAVILYTSGTTGRPKGAMLTHRNLVSNTFSVREALQLEPGREILLVVLPLFHSFAATVGMLFPLLHGCTTALLPRFDPALVAETIEATRATIFLGVPSMYSLFLRLPEESVSRFASLRYCVSGGAALPPAIQKQFEERFGKLIYEGDGPTECSPVTCVNPIGGKRKAGSVGKPIPAVEMKILDDRGDELPRGEVGEICVRGPNVMKGYWKLPGETGKSFFGEWFRTGDLGHEDEEGYFFIVDRMKDMVIVNGMNVYPRMVEDVLYGLPSIGEVAVVGEPHRLHGEIPVAHVVLKEGAAATEKEIRDFCSERLGRHEVPRKVHFLPRLPRNAAGKILKRELRRQGELERGVDLGE